MGEFAKQVKSFGAAGKGIVRTVREEGHMKFHLCIAVLALLACAVLGVEPWGWCVVIICIGLVIAGELVNTAIERLADRVTTEQDPLIGAAKDAAAGAVLVQAGAAVAAGLIVYIPALISFLH